MPQGTFASRVGLIVLQSALFFAVLGGASAYALPIDPGFDLFTTEQTPSSSYNFSSDPIPGGFFGPGSDPFGAVVVFRGSPSGGTDTRVRRLTDGLLGPPPSGVTVPIELVQLNLVSCNPITVTYSGGQNPEPWNIVITLDNTQTSSGQMNISNTSANGGTFSSNLIVHPVLRFTPVIGGSTLELFRANTLSQPQATWSYAIPDGVLPSTNNFFPGGVPGDPTQLNSVFFAGSGLNLELQLTQVPEPATLSLLGLGVATLFLRRRRR